MAVAETLVSVHCEAVYTEQCQSLSFTPLDTETAEPIIELESSEIHTVFHNIQN